MTSFSTPSGVAVGPHDDIFVADCANHRVQRFDANGNYITQWGEFGSADSQFYHPGGVAVDPTGEAVYVADTENHRIQKFVYPTEDPVDVTDDVLLVGDITEGNVFYYLPWSQEWHFNLSARPYTAKGTYIITMESGDEAEYEIEPKCEALFIRQ